ADHTQTAAEAAAEHGAGRGEHEADRERRTDGGRGLVKAAQEPVGDERTDDPDREAVDCADRREPAKLAILGPRDMDFGGVRFPGYGALRGPGDAGPHNE